MQESSIRPQALFDQYLQLAAADAVTYFESAPRLEIHCPACGSHGSPAFSKSGFVYQLCPQCDTLYVSPRPVVSAFSDYYTSAPSVEFWATSFYEQTAEQRRKLIWEPKARQVSHIIGQHQSSAEVLVDIGAGYGIFCDVFSGYSSLKTLLVEPSPRLAQVCIERGQQVVQGFLEDLSRDQLTTRPAFFVSFELFEHLHDPRLFLQILNRLMKPGEIFVFTTLSGTGLDIQCLWENSKSVSPPHHLNFFNPHSIKILLEETGFSCLEVTTPGRLDINILQSNQELINNRFWRTQIRHINSTQQAEQLQSMIAYAGFSSHMLVICQKKSDTNHPAP